LEDTCRMGSCGWWHAREWQPQRAVIERVRLWLATVHSSDLTCEKDVIMRADSFRLPWCTSDSSSRMITRKSTCRTWLIEKAHAESTYS
jgi:hypothetical protein